MRWGSIHEFKGLEAPAVVLTDVDLSKDYHRDLLYVGASRATDRLVVLEQTGRTMLVCRAHRSLTRQIIDRELRRRFV